MALFNRMKIYSVHVNPRSEKPLEDAVFVPEGFSIAAFIFNVFWALYHRLWLVALLFLVLMVASTLTGKLLGLHPSSQFVLDLGTRLLLGMIAYDSWRASLERKGWITTDIIVAGNLLEATHRFYDRHAGRNPQPLFQNATPAPAASL